MDWFRNIPKFGTVFLLLLPVLAAELYAVQAERRLASRAQAELTAKKQERERLARSSIAPSEKNERAIEDDLVGAQESLQALQSAWRNDDEAGSPASGGAKPLEAFFEIAAFVERTRTLASNTRVQLKPAEHFSFGSYAAEGPVAEMLPAVVRQRALVQYLLETLIEAHPQALLAVERERPWAAAQRLAGKRPGQSPPARPDATGGPGFAGDFFELADAESLRVPGLVDSDAIRLEFAGQTQTLRSFLNSLASSSRSIVVRSVEAEPLVQNLHTGQPKSPGGAPAPAPLVGPHLSKFVVLVEHVVPIPLTGEAPP